MRLFAFRLRRWSPPEPMNRPARPATVGGRWHKMDRRTISSALDRDAGGR